MGLLLSDELPAPRPWVHRLLIATAIVAAISVMSLRRLPGLTHPWFWAEDGAIFFLQNATGTDGLFKPYQSQLWLLQRITALGIGLIEDPVAAASAYYLVAAVASALMLCVILARRCAPVFGSLPWRMLALIALVLLPGVTEIQGNLANLHVWAAIAALICLSCAEPMTTPGKVAELGLLTLTALSGFTAVVLLPVVVWSAWCYQTAYSRARCALLVVAGAGALLLGRGRSAEYGPFLGEVDSLPEVLLRRIGGTLVHGEAFVAGGFWLVPAGLVLLAVGGLALLDWPGPSMPWVLSGLIWVVLGALSLGSVSILLTPFAAGRYFPLLLSACVLVLLRAAALPRPEVTGIRLRRAVAVAGLCLIAIGAVRSAALPANPPLTAEEALSFQLCLAEGRDDCSIPSQPLGW